METVPDELWSPDSVDPYQLTEDWAASMDTVQEALTNLREENLSLAGLESERPTFGISGRTWYSTDTGRHWFDTGVAWISNDPGSYLIRPGAVTGAGVSISANGGVVLSGTPSGEVVQIRDIFFSRFRNYRVEASFSSKPSGVSLVQGLVGATVVTAATHSRALQSFVAGARSDIQTVSATTFGEVFVPSLGTAGGGTADILAPNVAEPTFMLSQLVLVGGTTGVLNSSATLNGTQQLTGLQIALAAGAPWTGEIRIYGYA